MIDRAAILDALRTVPDPEMPISIVDLGLVETVRIEGEPGAARVTIDLLPTFVGCPALEMIANDVTARVGALAGVASIGVRFVYDPPWTVDRISEAGRSDLAAHGVTVPEQGSTLPVAGHHGGAVELRTSVVPCPFCQGDDTTLESMFGPTRCRSIYYCNGCKNTFEQMKRI